MIWNHPIETTIKKTGCLEFQADTFRCFDVTLAIQTDDVFWSFFPSSSWLRIEKIVTDSLKLTAKDLKIDHPKWKVVLQPSIFGCKLLVSGRVNKPQPGDSSHDFYLIIVIQQQPLSSGYKTPSQKGHQNCQDVFLFKNWVSNIHLLERLEVRFNSPGVIRNHRVNVTTTVEFHGVSLCFRWKKKRSGF